MLYVPGDLFEMRNPYKKLSNIYFFKSKNINYEKLFNFCINTYIELKVSKFLSHIFALTL